MKTAFFIIGSGISMAVPPIVIALVACNPQMDLMSHVFAGIAFFGSLFSIYTLSEMCD